MDQIPFHLFEEGPNIKFQSKIKFPEQVGGQVHDGEVGQLVHYGPGHQHEWELQI